MASKNLKTYERMCERGEFERDITSERSRAAMIEAFTPDFVIVVPASLPQGGVWEGRDERSRGPTQLDITFTPTMRAGPRSA